MPELPEVETTASGIRGIWKALGSRVGDSGYLVAMACPGTGFTEPDRRVYPLRYVVEGNIFLLSGSGTQILHLGMSGTFAYPFEAGTESRKHDHIDMQISGAGCFA